jgi:hypothetical protein
MKLVMMTRLFEGMTNAEQKMGVWANVVTLVLLAASAARD